jgi:hypothetical protein
MSASYHLQKDLDSNQLAGFKVNVTFLHACCRCFQFPDVFSLPMCVCNRFSCQGNVHVQCMFFFQERLHFAPPSSHPGECILSFLTCSQRGTLVAWRFHRQHICCCLTSTSSTHWPIPLPDDRSEISPKGWKNVAATSVGSGDVHLALQPSVEFRWCSLVTAVQMSRFPSVCPQPAFSKEIMLGVNNWHATRGQTRHGSAVKIKNMKHNMIQDHYH